MMSESRDDHYFCYFLVGLIFTYVALYNPFVSVSLIDPNLRIGVELFLIILFFLLWMSNTPFGFLPTNFILILIIGFWLLLSDSQESPGLVTKVVFLIFAAQTLRRSAKLLNLTRQVWVFFWVLISVQAILGAIGQYFGILSFSLWEELTDSSARYFNPYFGFSHSRNYFGIIFARVSSYMDEPQVLGLFSGLNVLGAPYLLHGGQEKKFRILSLIAGIASGSLSFLLFFLSLGVFRFLGNDSIQVARKNKMRLFLFLFIGVIVSFVIMFYFGIAESSSSMGDRIFRLYIGVDALKQGNIYSWLFGNLNYQEAIGAKSAISNGLFTVLVQRGLIPLVILVYVLYKYSQRHFLLTVYLFYYAMFLEYFWYPAFMLYLALFYVLSLGVDWVKQFERIPGNQIATSSIS